MIHRVGSDFRPSRRAVLRTGLVALGGAWLGPEASAGAVLGQDEGADGADRQHVPPPDDVRIIDILSGTAEAVVMSHDGTLVAASGHGGVIRVWDGRTGRERRTIEVRQGPIRVLTLSADGRRIVSCNPRSLEMSTGGISQAGRFQGTVLRVWETATGALLGEHATDDEVLRFAFGTPDGRRVVFVDEGELLAWEVASGRVQAVEARVVPPGAESSVTGISGCSDSGHRIVAFAAKPVPRRDPVLILKVWEVEQRRIRELDLQPIGRGFSLLTIDPQGRSVAMAHKPDIPPGQPGDGHRLYTILDLDTGEVATRLHTRPEFPTYVHFLGFDPDGTRVVSGTSTGSRGGNEVALWLWDARDGSLIRSFRSPGGEIRAVSFLSDGRLRVVSKESRPVLDERGNLNPEESLKVWEAGPA